MLFAISQNDNFNNKVHSCYKYNDPAAFLPSPTNQKKMLS